MPSPIRPAPVPVCKTQAGAFVVGGPERLIPGLAAHTLEPGSPHDTCLGYRPALAYGEPTVFGAQGPSHVLGVPFAAKLTAVVSRLPLCRDPSTVP